ncbi:MAG: sigma-70 family RNA polymerase sigma factor [Deltaproteobacteria bacterium]
MSEARGEVVRLPTAAAPEDDVLVRRALEGDSSAEEALYRRHALPLLNTLIRLTSNRDDALDVVQDAFVQAFRRLPQLTEPAAFRGWLRTIACRIVYRQSKRRRVLCFFGLAPPEVSRLSTWVRPGTSPEVLAELRTIDEVLTGLPAALRVAWVLRYVEEETLQDVAEQCGCSLATAKRRIKAAREAIDEALGDVS